MVWGEAIWGGSRTRTGQLLIVTRHSLLPGPHGPIFNRYVVNTFSPGPQIIIITLAKEYIYTMGSALYATFTRNLYTQPLHATFTRNVAYATFTRNVAYATFTRNLYTQPLHATFTRNL